MGNKINTKVLIIISMALCIFSCEAPDVHVSFVSPDDLYAPQDKPPESNITDWTFKAWKGEKVHTQILLWSEVPLKEIEIEKGELVGPNAKLGKQNIDISFLGYVWSDSGAARKKGCAVEQGQDSILVADVIENIKYKNVSANTLQPIWLSIDIPKDTPAGLYQGSIRFLSKGDQSGPTLKYSVEVGNRVLPDPKEWSFHLNLWQNPDAVARVHDVEKWSPEHLEAMKPYMRKLMEAGQKVITTTLIHDPWNSQTKDVYDTMIKWTKETDGSWRYDYSVFDRYVTSMLENNQDGLIESFSMIPWNLKFYYHDENLGKDTVLVAEPGSIEYRDHWKPMLSDFARHLKEKEWFDQTAIAMDERPMEAMQEAIKIIKAADKDFKISLAGNYHPEIESSIFDYSVFLGESIANEKLAERRSKGLKTTIYTSCSHEYPNTFTGSPPAESAWLGWFVASEGYDGYLRWAYNSWPKDPLFDSRFGSWPSGDTYLIYPGALSSVRFERLIEGIEDYEKIRILKEDFQKNNQEEKLAALEEILNEFTVKALDHNQTGEMVKRANKAINDF